MTESGAPPENIKHWVAWAEEKVVAIDPLAGGYLEPLLGEEASHERDPGLERSDTC